jgi:LPS-assembly protein
LVTCVAPVYAEDQVIDPVGTNEISIPTTSEQEINEKKSTSTKSGRAVTVPSNPDEIHIRAEQMTGRPERILNLDGQVEITRGLSTIDSDTAEYHAVEDLVMANGNVQMMNNNDCYSGDTLQLQMDTGAGYLSNPVYQLEKNNARGFAKRLNFVDENRSVVEQGIYTTCAGTKPDWYLSSSRLNLDSDRDEGVAIGGVVYFKEVPILAAPWLSFPISGARRSGFLPPEYNSTTAGGIEFMLPYYLDIAPNRDATFYPNYITKRGMQLGGEFRYLESTYNGKFYGEVTPNDEITDTTRYTLSYLHNQSLLPGLTMNWNYNRASDNQYAIDYSHSITESSQHLLPQTFSLIYGKSWGTVGLLTSNYQVLQDANNSIVKPYEIMPKLFAQFDGSDDFGGFDWSVGTEYANFLSDTAVNGKRLAVNAQISYPITGTYYFVIPKALYHLSSYQLGSNLAPGSPSDPTLSVPTFSLDSGLIFERDTELLGRNVTQTIEPRLFYVRTPFRDQSNIPLFDTGIADLNFSQIFSENRFSGQDRVGDANQLTAGLISRVIEMDGQERIRLGVAQRISFSQPLVVDNPFFVSREIQNGEPIFTTHSTIPSKSDLIFAANGKVTNTISANAVWQYSQSQHNTGRMSYGFRWQPAPMKVFNAEYRFQDISEVNPEVMRQIDVSVQWPLADRWYGVARTNYSVVDQRILDGLVGFEYKQDCWIFRAVAQRYQIPSTVANVTSSSTTSLFLQLELNGLSKIGTNPLDVLRRSIPGYQPINQPTTQTYYQ